ncbi:hypothetical protein DY000_02054089 [Brassica cretica]|uniref:Putative plant transposon protein domain-containing protein n=1 Tax=Brassica cretica TaxID=69181 RepID=A0ABQ7AD50_BRACR|nr:hypothetical protein DY000_02054089 [Brassica cretica]
MESTVSSLGSYVEQVISELYAGIPNTKVEADTEHIAVKVRDHLYKFSPTVINEALEFEPLSEEEEDEDTTLDAILATKLAEFLIDGTQKEWENLTSADLTPCYGALMIIAAHNWIPSTHKPHVSFDRARLIYKMAHGTRVNMGNVGVKNGHDELNIQISIKIITKQFLRKLYFVKNFFTKNLALKSCSNLDRTKSRLSQSNGHVSKPATDKLGYGNRTTDKPSSVATQRPSMHTARLLRSDQACTRLGSYVATDHAYGSVAT